MLEKGLFAELKKGGLEAAPEQRRNLGRYHRLLTEWNQRINLVSRGLAAAVFEELYYDSLVPVLQGLVEPRARCLDIGSGAGIPGLILALFRPDLVMTLVESVRKKVLFLNKARQELGLDRTEVLHRRAETLVSDSTRSGQYGIVLFKAFKDTPACVRLGIPLLQEGGKLIIYKGEAAGTELDQWRGFFPCYFFKIIGYILPESKKKRNLLIVTRSSEGTRWKNDIPGRR